jgi:hypothetical protein
MVTILRTAGLPMSLELPDVDRIGRDRPSSVTSPQAAGERSGTRQPRRPASAVPRMAGRPARQRPRPAGAAARRAERPTRVLGTTRPDPGSSWSARRPPHAPGPSQGRRRRPHSGRSKLGTGSVPSRPPLANLHRA